MKMHFFKYQGTGNDFVIFDNRNGQYDSLTTAQIKHLCERRFGIGADGLMLLNTLEGYDFEMKYYNADGRESTMCGNGGRCLVKFAWHMGVQRKLYRFMAVDGVHEAEIDENGKVKLKMKDVPSIQQYKGDFIVDTGSPHYIKMVEDVNHYEVFERGRKIRNSDDFRKEGINVNFVEHRDEDSITVRTYERGVENETYSCGTGVTAAAIVCFHNEAGFNDVTVFTPGGKLSVEYDRLDGGSYANVWLCGPAEKVFEGTVETAGDEAQPALLSDTTTG